MAFTIRPYRRFPVQGSATYNAGPFQGQDAFWNLQLSGLRLSGDLPMRQSETLSLTVTLPNDRLIEVPAAEVRWSRGQEFAVETVAIEQRTQGKLQYFLKRLVKQHTKVTF